MTTFDDYFDAVFVISLPQSTERWSHALGELEKCGIKKAQRFVGYDADAYTEIPFGLTFNRMGGCTASHGALMHIIGNSGWKNALIFEDDFECLTADPKHDFDSVIQHVPTNWDLLYLGAGYGDKPLGRVNSHVLKVGSMKTTSSYAITREYARHVAPFICGVAGPDDLLSMFSPTHNAYCIQPRLFGQYANTSVIWRQFTHNSGSMRDTRHENMV